MDNRKEKKRSLKFWLFAPVTLLIIFAVTDNGLYKRAICAAYLILGFVLMRLAVLIPFKSVAVVTVCGYFFTVIPYLYYGLMKDFISPTLSKVLSLLLALATLFAAMAATSGL